MDIKCSNCGMEYPESLKLCPFCGMDNSVKGTVEIPEADKTYVEQLRVLAEEEKRQEEARASWNEAYIEQAKEPEPEHITDYWQIEELAPVQSQPKVVPSQPEVVPSQPEIVSSQPKMVQSQQGMIPPQPVAQTFAARPEPERVQEVQAAPKPQTPVQPKFTEREVADPRSGAGVSVRREEQPSKPVIPVPAESSFKQVDVVAPNKTGDEKEEEKPQQKSAENKTGSPQGNTTIVNVGTSNNDKPLSVGSFIGHSLLFAIPIVGIIMVIVYAVGGENTNTNLKNWSRAILLVALISVLLSLLLFADSLGTLYYLFRYM